MPTSCYIWKSENSCEIFGWFFIVTAYSIFKVFKFTQNIALSIQSTHFCDMGNLWRQFARFVCADWNCYTNLQYTYSILKCSYHSNYQNFDAKCIKFINAIKLHQGFLQFSMLQLYCMFLNNNYDQITWNNFVEGF